MSMRGINWFKERRHSERPLTSYKPPDPLLTAFESDAFKTAVASQLDPTITKLNQIRASNLNLESTIQSQLEAQKTIFQPIEDHLTNQLGDLLSGQARLLKSIDTRFDNLESRIEDLDRKLDQLDESVTNADLRSAIRFGELSNELQDRNTLLGDRIWEVQRDLGKKIDGQQRKILGACEELGKDVRNIDDSLEAMQTRMDEDSKVISRIESHEKALQRNMATGQAMQSEKFGIIMKEIESAKDLASQNSESEASRFENVISMAGNLQTLAKSTNEMSQGISNIATKEDVTAQIKNLTRLQENHGETLSDITKELDIAKSWNASKLEVVTSVMHDMSKSHATKEDIRTQVDGLAAFENALQEKQTEALVEIRKELEAAKNLRSSSSSKLDGFTSVLQTLAESTSEISKSHATKEDVQTIASSHAEKLKDAISIATRLEGALIALDAATLEKLGDIERSIAPQTTKLNNLGSSLQQIDITAAFSEMRFNIEAGLASQDESLESIQRKLRDDTSFNQLTTAISNIQSSLGSMKDNTMKGLDDIKQSSAKSHDHLSECFATIPKDTSTKKDISALLQTLEKNASTSEEVTTKQFTELSTKVDDVARSTSTKEDLTTLQTTLLQKNDSDIKMLSAKVDELTTSTTSSLQTLDRGVHSSTRSTADEIHEHFRGLDGNLDDRFASMKEAVNERMHSLTQVLEEVRTRKAFLETEIREELKTTRTSVDGSNSMMKSLQEGLRDDEILLQIESWGQNSIAKQTTNATTVVEMLQASKQQNEILQKSLADLHEKTSSIPDTLHSISSNALKEIKSTLDESSDKTQQLLNEARHDTQQMNPIITSIKQLLLQNASSMATSYEGILAIDTKLQSSEDSISSTIQDMQTSIGRDILDASSSITTSINDNLADVKIDLASRISTSTNVLRAEMKRIDPNLEALKDDIQSTSKTARDDLDRVAENIRSQLEQSTDCLTKAVTDLGHSHGQKLEENASTLSRLEEVSESNFEAISTDLSRTFSQVSETKEEARMIVTAIQALEHNAKSTTESLASIQGLIKKAEDQLSTVKGQLEAAIDTNAATTLKAVKENFEEVSSTNSASLSKNLAEIQEALEVSNTKEDVRMIAAAVQALSHTAKSHSGSLTTVHDLVSKVDGRFDEVVTDVKGLEKCTIEILDGAKTNQSIISSIEKSSSELPTIRQEIKALDSALSMSAETTEKFILSRLAATSGEILSVKSDISGVISSLVQVDIDRCETEKAQASILSTVKRTSADIHQIEENLKKAEEARHASFEAMKLDISGLGKSILEGTSKLDTRIQHDLETVNATIKNGIEGLNSSVQNSAEETVRVREVSITTLKSEAQSLLDAVTNGTESTKAAIESGLEIANKSILSDIHKTKKSLDVDLAAIQLKTQEMRKALEVVSGDIREGFDKTANEAAKAHEATVATIKSESTSLGDALLREARNTGKTLDAAKESIIEEVRDTKRAVDNVDENQKSLRTIINGISTNLTTGFADATTERSSSKNAAEANFSAMTKSIHQSTKTTQNAVESAHNRILSELQTTNLAIGSTLNGLKTDLGSVSKYIQTVNSGILGEIGSLSDKTIDGFTGLDASIRQTNSSMSKSIGNTEVSLQYSIENMSGSMKAIDAAVRVNSAAIARVDKAVLETGSQVKGVVLDGNRDVLFQLDEELHENGTRIRGISEYDIPRLEAIGKRNRDALEVIGARVLGTAKKFDEMVTHHGQRSLEHSEVLNGRLRAPSSTSSSVVLKERA